MATAEEASLASAWSDFADDGRCTFLSDEGAVPLSLRRRTGVRGNGERFRFLRARSTALIFFFPAYTLLSARRRRFFESNHTL